MRDSHAQYNSSTSPPIQRLPKTGTSSICSVTIFGGRKADSSDARGYRNTGCQIEATVRNNENLYPADLRSATCMFDWLKSQWLQLFGGRFFAPVFQVQGPDAAVARGRPAKALSPGCSQCRFRARTINSGTGYSFRSFLLLYFGRSPPRFEQAIVDFHKIKATPSGDARIVGHD